MCGITGIYSFNLVGKFNKVHIMEATQAISSRGPDFQDVYTDDTIALGHRRLSIIDTREVANQPMWDETGRYCIVFNGEIFNYRELRNELEQKGISFFSSSDTEVLLKLYIHEKEKSLPKLNGFFAFCIYDKVEKTFFVARDRYGIKPLLYLFDEDKFIFASEMKALLKYGVEKSLDYNSLFTYLQLNYIPGPDSILKGVRKLMPGHYLQVQQKQLEIHSYYEIPFVRDPENPPPYEDAKLKLRSLLEASVERRLIADVPLGAFLSGGIDSSIITGIASKHKPDLHTFSIGFRDEPFFDETEYARLVAKHFKTDHTVFSLTNNDLYSHLNTILDHIDEPFADSSAIAVYILSKETRKHATVALSGDGADELFGGYNKHAGAYRVLHPGWKEKLVNSMHPLWNSMGGSRNNPIANKLRQFKRFADGMKMNSRDRYWQWASFANRTEAMDVLHPDLRTAAWLSEFPARRKEILKTIPDEENINDILLTDTRLVLTNDMLTKVDLMSMANGLEVRVPFLDFELVNFVFSLPSNYKVNAAHRKAILKDAYRDMLPAELYHRPKKGFEVPLLKWFRTDMRSMIVDDLLSEKLILEQGIFHYPAISKLKDQLFSSNPGDSHARIWGMIVFQRWWKKYFR